MIVFNILFQHLERDLSLSFIKCHFIMTVVENLSNKPGASYFRKLLKPL